MPHRTALEITTPSAQRYPGGDLVAGVTVNSPNSRGKYDLCPPAISLIGGHGSGYKSSCNCGGFCFLFFWHGGGGFFLPVAVGPPPPPGNEGSSPRGWRSRALADSPASCRGRFSHPTRCPLVPSWPCRLRGESDRSDTGFPSRHWLSR